MTTVAVGEMKAVFPRGSAEFRPCLVLRSQLGKAVLIPEDGH